MRDAKEGQVWASSLEVKEKKKRQHSYKGAKELVCPLHFCLFVLHEEIWHIRYRLGDSIKGSWGRLDEGECGAQKVKCGPVSTCEQTWGTLKTWAVILKFMCSPTFTLIALPNSFLKIPIKSLPCGEPKDCLPKRRDISSSTGEKKGGQQRKKERGILLKYLLNHSSIEWDWNEVGGWEALLSAVTGTARFSGYDGMTKHWTVLPDPDLLGHHWKPQLPWCK